MIAKSSQLPETGKTISHIVVAANDSEHHGGSVQLTKAIGPDMAESARGIWTGLIKSARPSQVGPARKSLGLGRARLGARFFREDSGIGPTRFRTQEESNGR